jgi:hypothetical protein
MTASRPWLGISKPNWLIKSDTPQTTRRQLASNQLVPLPEPARRGLINLADDVLATTNQAVAAGAQLDPSDVTRSTRSGQRAHRGRSAASLQITHPHDPAPRGPRR